MSTWESPTNTYAVCFAVSFRARIRRLYNSGLRGNPLVDASRMVLGEEQQSPGRVSTEQNGLGMNFSSHYI